MKVKIFSHKSDPDGLGSPILATLAFGEGSTITLCQGNEELALQLENFIKKEEYKEFELIFITDLCPTAKYLEEIEKREELKNKILIFDHHKSSMAKITKEYSFLTETESRNRKKCCGTSLFYEYLLKENKLKDKETIKTFVLLTRLHDTYEWQEEKNLEAYNLQILFQFLGPWGYLYHFVEKMNQESKFSYTDLEQTWIKEQKRKNKEKIEELANNIVTLKKEGMQYGLSIANYEYRNLLADYLKEQKRNLDALLLIAGDEMRFSFRSLKKEIEVLKFAELCGGNGHPSAAGGELNQETLQKILKFIK